MLHTLLGLCARAHARKQSIVHLVHTQSMCFSLSAIPPPPPHPQPPPPPPQEQLASSPRCSAADVFLTCSTSETYGLTTLEALACGTPSVLPHCDVFDELWTGKVRALLASCRCRCYRVKRLHAPLSTVTHILFDETLSIDAECRDDRYPQIPSEWFYDSQNLQSLIDALRCAGCADAKKLLMANPIKASWADATNELVQQYEEAIEKNLPNRVELASYTRVFNQFLKAALFTALTFWLLRGYTHKVSSWTLRDRT